MAKIKRIVYLCPTKQTGMNQGFTLSSSTSFFPLAEIHSFSAKERDAETGLSYFGSRYYSSDLSIWLSVDPMSDKYPSLSPYVYCADNPVKLVDPEGEEAEEPGDPPKRNVVQKIWDGYVKIDKACEGHSDGSNQVCEFTKRDWNVGLGISSGLLCSAVLIESGGWLSWGIGMANNIDDIGSNNQGESILQQLTDNNPYVNVLKAAGSVFSGYMDVRSIFKFKNHGFSALDAVSSTASTGINASATIKSINKSAEKTSSTQVRKPVNSGTSQQSSCPLPSFCTQNSPQYELFLNSTQTKKK